MKKAKEFLRKSVADSIKLKKEFFDIYENEILAFYEALLKTQKAKSKVLIFGNGGSAADAQHFAAELMHRVEKRPIGLRALALHTDTSLLTAFANDEVFGRIFAHQIGVLASPGDLAIAISTSGKSPNIVEGLRAAKEVRCNTVGLLGRDGGPARALCDLP